MVVGIVKNFEFTTRSDGGFDCTTTITSVGTDFIKKVTPAKGSTNMTVRIGAKKGESAEDLKKKLESDIQLAGVKKLTFQMFSMVSDRLLDPIDGEIIKSNIRSEAKKTPDYDPDATYEYETLNQYISENVSELIAGYEPLFDI